MISMLLPKGVKKRRAAPIHPSNMDIMESHITETIKPPNKEVLYAIRGVQT
jgi:hypothetical protein